MDFTPTPEQEAARELAAQIFGDLSTPERLAALGDGTDGELWKALGGAGLAGAVEETGLLGLVLMLEEQGRTTAQVPFAASCVFGLLAVAAHGTDEQRERLLPGLRDGSAVATGAFPGRGGIVITPADAGAGRARLTGAVPWVPWLRDATHVLVAVREPAGPGGVARVGDAGVGRRTGKVTHSLWIVLADDARCEPVELTAPWSAGRLVLDGTTAERIGGPETYDEVLAAARAAFAGLQAGVCAGSLARAVEYTNQREQFGRPLAAKQGVQLRAAEAHMDVEAIRVTAYEAAWRRDAGLGHRSHALTAAWWASEAGKRVVHAGQHLHGGMGADLDHPVHRHFLWGRQLDGYLGSGSEVLEELGALIAVGTDEGGESA
ncbi:acyl-CoA dehydrogenase family protein [Streptomyces longispororuber]|uniref:acyl-CoA dehydrogenase family protein n=1 Tax=Streptomyces longispororuber TaxID=68230 RepID=UPI00210D7137|nr:acyl-CoA dehydrogenase family protein [Streptomyces longispororuber]MCQ4213452.1 acyl-CoA dehydrogenase family protein [Streptomyces longispororuber]